MTDAALIRNRAAGLVDAGGVLRVTSLEDRAQWLVEAAETLAQQVRQASRELGGATGLSAPMVEWASDTTLGTIRKHSMLRLAKEAAGQSEPGAKPVALLSVVLAGNVFTAPVRGILVPLLLGTPVLVKASSKESRFPAMLRDALRRINLGLGAAIDVVRFPGGDLEREAAFVECADLVSVYGSDETIRAMTARLGGAAIVGHGHGVSAAYCGAKSMSDANLSDTIRELSLDVCAYDQRGCLSPQLVYVEESAEHSVGSFARRLASEGLEPMSLRLPRGPLPPSIGAKQAQWRGLAEVEGTLICGATYAVAVRPARAIRWSPGYRNVTLVPVRGVADALQAMEPIGSNLKCVGADPASISEIRTQLERSPGLSAYACALGTMQTPALDAPADGRPIWHGLLRP